MTTSQRILEVTDVTLRFPRRYGSTEILRDVSIELARGETLGVVGESGSGKSLLGLTILGLEPSAAVLTGRVAFAGRDMASMSGRERRQLRGDDIAMIYQDALVSLNPGMPIRKQLDQAIGRGRARTPRELLESVQLTDADRFLDAYPHQLSGGQRQRVLIAMAIAREPSLVIADEPTTALDVSVQAHILRLLDDLRDRLQFGLVLISHDLGLVASHAERIAVMYAGDVVETGATADVLAHPAHPYTAGLVEASLSLEQARPRLAQIPGIVPVPGDFSPACRFADRCARSAPICRSARPPAVSTASGAALCYFPLTEGAPEVGLRSTEVEG
jgi:peptide/nickel transport system permease protein